MKSKILFLLVALGAICLATSLRADVSTNTAPFGTGPGSTNLTGSNVLAQATGSSQFNADLAKLGGDLWQDVLNLQPLTTNGVGTAYLGYGRNLSTKNNIFAAMFTMPTSAHTAIGVAGYHMGSTWAEGAVSLQITATNTVPILGALHYFVADGPAWSFSQNGIVNFASSGIQKDWDISSRWHAGLGAVIANTSDRPGVDVIIGGHLTYHW